MEVQTLVAPPEQPTLLHADCQPDAAVRVWWRRPSLAESLAVRYLLQSRADDSAAAGTVAEVEVPAKEGQVSRGVSSGQTGVPRGGGRRWCFV